MDTLFDISKRFIEPQKPQSLIVQPLLEPARGMQTFFNSPPLSPSRWYKQKWKGAAERSPIQNPLSAHHNDETVMFSCDSNQIRHSGGAWVKWRVTSKFRDPCSGLHRWRLIMFFCFLCKVRTLTLVTVLVLQVPVWALLATLMQLLPLKEAVGSREHTPCCGVTLDPVRIFVRKLKNL